MTCSRHQHWPSGSNFMQPEGANGNKRSNYLSPFIHLHGVTCWNVPHAQMMRIATCAVVGGRTKLWDTCYFQQYFHLMQTHSSSSKVILSSNFTARRLLMGDVR